MNTVYVKRIHPNATIPTFAHSTDSGADATTPERVVITPGKTVRVPLGFALLIPPGHEVQGRPKSGLSSKGIHVAFGTVDEGYRGELQAIITNSTPDVFVFEPGSKVLQLVLAERVRTVYREVDNFDSFDTDTPRGDRGFGSTGA